MASLRERLQREFGCADADAARAKLAKMEKRETALAEQYAEQKKAFEAQFAQQLEGIR